MSAIPLPADAQPDIRARFVEAMSFSASTVNIVTTDGPAGRHGVTVSAMSSISADGQRPTLLFCLNHASRSAAAFIANGVFCLNVLRDDQAHISDRFARRIPAEDEDKFACANWAIESTGAPRLVDPLVAFDCRILSSERVGTHHVVFGAVESIFIAGAGSPLIYANRSYGTAQPIPAARHDDRA